MTITHPQAGWKLLFQKRVILALMLIGWKFVVVFHTLAFISDRVNGLWKFLVSPTGSFLVMLVGFGWLAVQVLRPKPPTSLKERTLLLCRELSGWLKELGSQPREKPFDTGDAEEFIKSNWAISGQCHNRLFYGYQLRFADRVERIFYELGEQSTEIEDQEIIGELTSLLAKKDKEAKDVKIIADRLTFMAGKLY